jgi:hypothetical protein
MSTINPDNVFLIGSVYEDRDHVNPDELRNAVVIVPAGKGREDAIQAFLAKNSREKVISAVTLREIENAAKLLRQALGSIETYINGVEIIELS